MLHVLKSTTKNSIIYSLGNLSKKLVGFILLPFYTKEFTVSEYGILGLSEISTQIIVTIFGFGLHTAYFRWYWDENNFNRRKSIFFTCCLFIVVVNTVFFLICIPYQEYISFSLFNSEEYSGFISLIIINAALQIFLVLPNTLIRIQEKPLLFTYTNLISLICSLFFIIYFVSYNERGIAGVYQGLIIGNSINLIILIRFLIKNLSIRVEFEVLKEMLAYSFPLIFTMLSNLLLIVTDRYLLKIFSSLEEVGIYSLGFRIANTTKVFFINSVNSAISPLIFKVMNQDNHKRIYSKIMTYYTFGVVCFILPLSVFSKEIVSLVASNDDYLISFQIIPILSISAVFGMLVRIGSIGLRIKKKTGILSVIVVGASIINIFINILLIPYFGANGAAIATLFSQLLLFILIYSITQKIYFIPYELKKIFLQIFLGAIIIGICLIFNSMNIFFRLPLKIILIITFPFILYFFNFYEPIELVRLKQSWRKWRNPLNWKKNLKKIGLS